MATVSNQSYVHVGASHEAGIKSKAAKPPQHPSSQGLYIVQAIAAVYPSLQGGLLTPSYNSLIDAPMLYPRQLVARGTKETAVRPSSVANCDVAQNTCFRGPA